MSIILSGMAAGAGDAGVKAGLEYEKNAGDMELQKARDEAHLARETTLQQMRDKSAREMELEVRQPFEQGQQDRRFKNEGDLQDKRIGADNALADKRIVADKDAAAVKQAFDKEQHELNRDLTREQIAAQKSIAASNNGIALQIAKIGGAASQDKEGNMIWVNKDGTSQKIMDPSKPGEQLKGFKDLSPAAKAMLDIKKAEMVGLNAQETAAMGDQVQLAKIAEQRVKINREVLNIATMGTDGASTPKPTGERPPLSAFDKGAGGEKPKGGIINGELREPPGTPRPLVDGRARDADLAAEAEQEAVRNEAETERLRGVVKNSKTNPAVY